MYVCNLILNFQSPTPAPYVKESNDTGQFYTNRVLKEWKEKYLLNINCINCYIYYIYINK